VRGIERPFWQLDGRAVVIEAVDAERRQGLFRVDLESDAVETLVQSLGFTSAFAGFSPDGSLIYARYNRAESTIRRRSPLAAVEDVLWPDVRGTGANVLSPDGRVIAFWRGNSTTASLSVGPTSGGERRPLVSELHNSDNEIAWNHDGKYVLFAKLVRLKETDPWSGEVWRVSVDGGAAEPLGIHTGLIKHLSARPDGREVAISVIGGGSRELLAWENIPGLVKNMSSR
jgi:Tol biopolymer transport system component